MTDFNLLGKQFNKFNDNILKLDSYLINKIGILKNKCFFKINDYTIYCVPFELSYDSCSAFSILNAKEIGYFATFIGKLMSLSIDFINPLFSKTTTIFLRATIEKFDIQESHTKYCIIKANIKRASDDYKMILTDQFIRIDYIRQLYENEEKSKIMYNTDYLKKCNLDPVVNIKIEDNFIKYKGRIIEISFKKVIIFSEILKKDAVKKNVTIEFMEEDNIIFAKGKIIEIAESNEVQGFYIITIEYDYSYAVIDILSC